jgi:hypothetical protein
MTMNEHPSMVIKQELFDKLINAQVALFKQIEAKQRIEETTITQEEADFANVFLEYAKELTIIVEEQL